MESFLGDAIHRLPWPEGGSEVRFVLRHGGLWFVAADVCRPLRFTLNKAGDLNITLALARVDPADKVLARLETSPGTFRPFTRYMLVSENGLETLIAEGIARRVQRERLSEGPPALARLVNVAARNLVEALGGEPRPVPEERAGVVRLRPAVGR